MEENKNANAVNLVKNLFDHGIKDVRFFDDLSQHPMVQEKMSKQEEPKANGSKCLTKNQARRTNEHGNGCQVQITSTTPINPFDLNPLVNQLSSSLPLSHFLSFNNCDPTALFAALYSPSPNPGTPLSRTPPLTPTQRTSPLPAARSMKRKEPPLVEEFLKCRLCSSDEPAIQITNYNNVTRHLKRHLNMNLRQFQCTECTFASNATTKVSAHMAQQHGLTNVHPVENHDKFEPHFDRLVKDCFPTYNTQMDLVRAAQTERNLINAQLKNGQIYCSPEPSAQSVAQPRMNRKRQSRSNNMDQVGRKGLTSKRSTNLVTYHCYECRIGVQCVLGYERHSDGPLITHLRTAHSFLCMPWKCEECGWKNACQWKVRRHICVRHPVKAHQVGVIETKKAEWKLFLRNYFIDLDNSVPEDPEELETEKMAENGKFLKNLLKRKAEIKNSEISLKNLQQQKASHIKDNNESAVITTPR